MTALASAVFSCAACQSVLATGESTCRSCGSPVFPPARRLVTVLFVDLTGYTVLCSQLDVEDVHNLVRPVMNGLRRVCTDLGGVVAGIEGDGFMAVFGALAATEDDPRRAVLAAVEMQRLLRDRKVGRGAVLPALRVGLNVGEALVAPSWEASGFSVSGDVVNVASRLCQACSPGGVLAAADLVRFAPLSRAWASPTSSLLRGRDEPVLTRELDWTSLDRPALTLRTSSSRDYVPRPHLEAQLEALVRDGSHVQVVGEAGIGKSRLVAAVLARAAGERLVGVAGFPAFDQGRPTFGAVLDSLWCEEVAEAYAALPVLDRRRVDRARGLPVGSDEVDPVAQQLEAVGRLLLAVSARSPLTVVLEDAHWASSAELLFLASLAETAGSDRLGLVMTSRVGGSLIGPTVEVTPLQGAELDLHVERLLPGLTDDVRQLLVSRAGGSPFYLEQCAELLVEEGAVASTEGGWQLVAPDRLHRIPVVMRQFLSARIDGLDPHQQLVVRTAAVLGDSIDLGLLAYLCGREVDLSAVVTGLIDRGLLEPAPGPEPMLAFRHQLLRDVAYEGLLKSQRVAVHRAAAEWYSVLPVVQLLAAEVAHLEAAISLGEPDCELIRRAVEVLTHFGLSIAEERTGDAAAALDRAEALVTGHPGCDIEVVELRLAQAQVLELLGREDESASSAAAALVLARAGSSKFAEARALLHLGRARLRVDREGSLEDLTSAEALFVELGDLVWQARVEIARAMLWVDLGQRLAAFARAYRAAEVGGEPRLANLAAQDLAQHLAMRDPSEAVQWLALSSESLRSDDAVGRARLHASRAVISSMRGELVDAVRFAHEAAALAEDAESAQLVMFTRLFELESLALLGRLEEAQALADDLQELAATRPTAHLEVDVAMVQVLIHHRRGRGAEARDLLVAVRPTAESLGSQYVEQWHGFHARLLLESGHFTPAWQEAELALGMTEQLELPAYALRNRMMLLVGRLLSGAHVGLAEASELRSEARQLGADPVAGLTARWLELEDSLHGFADHALDLPDAPDLAEGRALDLEITALRTGRPALLLEAAAAWGELGTTVWQARALVWHGELTDEPHPEADVILSQLQAPEGLADSFREQVRHLHD